MQLDLDLLRTFVTVYKSNSFSQAGELLHRTQSAISLQIKRLEDRVGSAVFDRQRRTPALTATGQLLFDYSLRILSLHDEAVSRLEGPNLRGRIRLGILEELGAEVLPSVLGKLPQHRAGQLRATCQTLRRTPEHVDERPAGLRLRHR